METYLRRGWTSTYVIRDDSGEVIGFRARATHVHNYVPLQGVNLDDWGRVPYQCTVCGHLDD